MHVYTCLCISLSLSLYIRIYIYICEYMHVSIYIYVYMYICMCIYVYIYIYIDAFSISCWNPLQKPAGFARAQETVTVISLRGLPMLGFLLALLRGPHVNWKGSGAKAASFYGGG